jgi:hypothetical protein
MAAPVTGGADTVIESPTLLERMHELSDGVDPSVQRHEGEETWFISNIPAKKSFSE